MSWFARFCREKFLEQKLQHFHDFVFPTFSNWISRQEFWLHCSELHHNQPCSDLDHKVEIQFCTVYFNRSRDSPFVFYLYESTFKFYLVSDQSITSRPNHYLESPESSEVEMTWLFIRIFSYFWQSFREFNIFVQVLGTSYFWQVWRIKLLLN